VELHFLQTLAIFRMSTERNSTSNFCFVGGIIVPPGLSIEPFIAQVNLAMARVRSPRLKAAIWGLVPAHA
jgi:hypothetical protein